MVPGIKVFGFQESILAHLVLTPTTRSQAKISGKLHWMVFNGFPQRWWCHRCFSWPCQLSFIKGIQRISWSSWHRRSRKPNGMHFQSNSPKSYSEAFFTLAWRFRGMRPNLWWCKLRFCTIATKFCQFSELRLGILDRNDIQLLKNATETHFSFCFLWGTTPFFQGQ